MRYRSAVLGCGPRSEAHFGAYEGLDEMTVTAACDRDEERLRQKGEQFGIANLYTDLDEMLAAEKPDVLHIVTLPAVREGPIESAGRFGVKGVIVEKPIALGPVQARTIGALAARYGLKVAVNTQRRYIPGCQTLKAALAEGRIGEILFVRCATRGNLLSMGPHMIDMLEYFLDDLLPASVWACAHGMNGYDYGHPAPAKVLARYVYPNGVTAYLEDADDAVCTPGEQQFWQHFRLDLWGSTGRAWYSQNHEWGCQAEDMPGRREATGGWEEEDSVGQREFTRAMAHWLDDERKVHLNCLDNSLNQFDLLMGAMLSAHLRRPLELPADVPDDIVATVEKELSQ